MSQIHEKLMLSGSWIYGGIAEMEVHIIKSNFKPGSGDYEDDPEVREDQFGEFYDIHIGKYIKGEAHLSGSYTSINSAKEYALKVCPSLNWG
ncbi:hypothetical protein L2737_12000 [Shewanella electrodiphila]|uniref:Uncharacterized protein n=1 Tax=Shewanella electrodiphila TaxID=934143 RepID=A0ABT0KQB8_9GAMM|nr:hypothetical protein [Shewanella electrodiphila]MCL1046047.1 hypothetical protein [Shewanella electrodiphila]